MEQFMQYSNLLSKIVAAGGDYHKIRFTFQEYFRRMSEDPQALEPAVCSTARRIQRADRRSDCRLSEERTPCPVPLMRSMYRRHWYLLQ